MHCKKKRHTSLKIFEVFSAARSVAPAPERREARRATRDVADSALLGTLFGAPLGASRAAGR